MSDPGLEHYRAFGLGRTGLQALVDPRGLGARRGVRDCRTASARSRREMLRQLPGVFVVQGGSVLAEYRHRSPADRPDYVGLMPQVSQRYNDVDAFRGCPPSSPRITGGSNDGAVRLGWFSLDAGPAWLALDWRSRGRRSRRRHSSRPHSSPPTATATDTRGASPSTKKPVVVTASKVEQQLVNAPATVSVVTSDVIRVDAGHQLRGAAPLGAGHEPHRRPRRATSTSPCAAPPRRSPPRRWRCSTAAASTWTSSASSPGTWCR